MKKILKLTICLLLMLISIYLIYNYYEGRTFIENDQTINIKDKTIINKMQKKYHNKEIMLYLEVPQIIGIPIPQTQNNNFYYSHNINKKKSNNTSPFLDYRNKSFSDKKIIIYGHNTMNKTLPFSKLLDYQNKEFFENNKKINIYTEHGKKAYTIFSVFNETNDSDYLELNGFAGLKYYEHLLKLKNKSIYDTKTNIDENSKVLVLQTCTLETNCKNNNSYLVIIAREDKNE